MTQTRISRHAVMVRAAAELEWRKRQAARQQQTTFDPLNPPADMGFRAWCEELGKLGLKVDGHPFTLANRKALHAIYDLIPATPAEAFERTIVIMKGAQMGLTIWETLADLYMAIKWRPITIGMYLPDQNLASYKSEHRFMRIVRTIRPVYEALTAPPAGAASKTASGEGNKLTRTLLESIFLFLWTSGKAMTESFPADVVSFDEVQGMTPDDISRTKERLSASAIKFSLLLSTPEWPDADIHFWHKQGTQHRFHTRCPGCGEMLVLIEHFPHCLHEDGYHCPGCGGLIDDPQDGEWIAQYPGREIESYHLPQLLSPTVTAKQILRDWHTLQTGKQKQNFYNRKLGLPYTDPSQIPVTMEHLEASVQAGRAAGVDWQPSATGAAMGIDQMGGFNCVMIAVRLPDGRAALIHAEAIFDPDPFARCDALMGQYGVTCCVVEGLPNWNDAKRFANRHPGRVFVASYGDQGDTLVWGDQISRTDRKTKEDERDRYTVRLSQYKAMQAALFRITTGQCLFPDPAGLVCDYRDGQPRTVALLRDVVFDHLTRVALITDRDPETGRWRAYVKKVGADPHFAYAWMLCDVAMARATGGTMFITADEPPKTTVGAAGLTLPPSVRVAIENAPEGTCGRCEAFKDGVCVERGFSVDAKDPGCFAYVAVPA